MKPQNTSYPHAEFKVGDKAHINRYSDIVPATVMEVRRNGDEVVLRVDSHKLAEGQKDGFESEEKDPYYGDHITFDRREMRERSLCETR